MRVSPSSSSPNSGVYPASPPRAHQISSLPLSEAGSPHGEEVSENRRLASKEPRTRTGSAPSQLSALRQRMPSAVSALSVVEALGPHERTISPPQSPLPQAPESPKADEAEGRLARARRLYWSRRDAAGNGSFSATTSDFFGVDGSAQSLSPTSSRRDSKGSSVPALASLPWERQRRQGRRSEVKVDTDAVMAKLAAVAAQGQLEEVGASRSRAEPDGSYHAMHDVAEQPGSSPAKDDDEEAKGSTFEDPGDEGSPEDLGRTLMASQLMAARASLGDKNERLRLAESRRQAAADAWQSEYFTMVKQLKALRREIAEHVDSHEVSEAELMAVEQERSEAHACLGGASSDMMDKLFSIGWSGSGPALLSAAAPRQLSMAAARDDVAREQLEERRTARMLHEVAARREELHSEFEAESSTQNRAHELQWSANRDWELKLQAEEGVYRRLMDELRAEQVYAQELVEQGRASEERAQRALQAEESRVERLQVQLRRFTEEVRTYQDRCDQKWVERFERQVSQRGDRNWQLQRRVAQAVRAQRDFDTNQRAVAELCQGLRAELQEERALQSARLQSREDARALLAAARAEEAAQRRSQEEVADETRCYHVALVDSLRRIVKVKTAAAKDASERALKSEVEALRVEVAREAKSLQEELAAQEELLARSRSHDWQTPRQLFPSPTLRPPSSALSPMSTISNSYSRLS